MWVRNRPRRNGASSDGEECPCQGVKRRRCCPAGDHWPSFESCQTRLFDSFVDRSISGQEVSQMSKCPDRPATTRRALPRGVSAAGAAVPATSAHAATQSGWRWCHKCQGLCFGANNVEGGRCPGGRSASRSSVGSGTYTLNEPGGGQPGWRWCANCAGLFHAGNGNWGHSPVRGVMGHTDINSGLCGVDVDPPITASQANCRGAGGAGGAAECG